METSGTFEPMRSAYAVNGFQSSMFASTLSRKLLVLFGNKNRSRYCRRLSVLLYFRDRVRAVDSRGVAVSLSCSVRHHHLKLPTLATLPFVECSQSSTHTFKQHLRVLVSAKRLHFLDVTPNVRPTLLKNDLRIGYEFLQHAVIPSGAEPRQEDWPIRGRCPMLAKV